MPAWSVGGWSSAIPIVQTNQVVVSVGSASVPSLAFQADPTTGIFQSAASRIDFSIAGSNDIRFSGNTIQLLSNANGRLLFGTAADVGISRNAAGVVEINNGTVGTLRDLIIRSVTASGATQGIGYATGAGGTVTQLTSKSTGVTLNTATGAITLNNAALAAQAIVSFTLTNSAVAANDLLVLNHKSVGTVGAYSFNAQPAAGSAVINVTNVTAGSLSEAIVVSYALIKGVVS